MFILEQELDTILFHLRVAEANRCMAPASARAEYAQTVEDLLVRAARIATALYA